MTVELKMLLWSVVLTFVQVVIASMGATQQAGLPALAGNREGMPELTGWAGRAQRAHLNMLENLPLFIALVLIAQLANRTERDDRAGRGAVLLGAAGAGGALHRRRAVAAHAGLGGLARRPVLIFAQLV